VSQNDIISCLGKDWTEMLAIMADALRTDVRLLEEINSSTLSQRGKLLRPMVSLLMARAVGSPAPDNLMLAAATELLHNATLMHDDVADDSDQRRGRPTLKSILGPTSAVLIGDFWLSRAVELVLDTACHEKVEKLFTRTLVNLSEGEMLQLEKSFSADTTEKDYLRIIDCKTASLFRTAAVSSAIAAGGSSLQVEAAGRYGESLGIAFQIKDDILDYTGDHQTGKPVGIDVKEGKITLPLLGAMIGSSEEDAIRGMVRNISSEPQNVDVVRRFVLENGGVEYAVSRLGDYVNAAVDALRAFDDSPAREYLADIARFNTFRKS